MLSEETEVLLDAAGVALEAGVDPCSWCFNACSMPLYVLSITFDF
jgi:hypothetical protein